MKKQLEQVINIDPKIEKKVVGGGLIIRKTDDGVDEVLLIRRAREDFWPHQWEFPKGKCEGKKDKSIRECTARELKEETGLDVKVGVLIDKYKYTRLEQNKKIISVCYNYKCSLLNPNQEVHLSKEHDQFKWVSEVGEVELMTTPEQKKTINKVLNDERSIVSYPVHQKIEENVDFYLEAIQKEIDIGSILSGAAAKTGAGIATAAPHLMKVYIAMLLLKIAADVYKTNFSRAARKCKGYAAGEKQICMVRAQITGKKASLDKLQSSMNKCNTDKNPEQCKGKLSGKIQSLQQEIGYLMGREKELRGKAATN